MALSADRITQQKDPKLRSYPQKGSTTIYAGGLVCINSSGFAVPAANASGNTVVGVAKAQSVNAGSDGAVRVQVETDTLVRLKASSITQAMVNKMMYIVDDETFDDAAGTYGIKAGRLADFISTTEGWIHVEPAGAGCVVADGDSTYGAPEASLINNLKALLNSDVGG